MTATSLLIAAFIFGAVTGSFLNVCIFRLPGGESVATPPSRCPRCGSRIRWYDNIPLLSYIFLMGRCRDCGDAISSRYPLVELLSGILTAALLNRFGFSVNFPVFFIFSSSLLVVTFIDLEHQIIPDEISLPGILLGFVFSFFLPWHSWLDSIFGILLGGGTLLLVASVYHKITGKEGMGGGDIKLLAMMGAFLGWRAVPFIIFGASLIGSVIGIALMIILRKDSRLAIPFGPYLAFAAMVYIFYGGEIISWYFRLGSH